jgi:hypothetical protein
MSVDDLICAPDMLSGKKGRGGGYGLWLIVYTTTRRTEAAMTSEPYVCLTTSTSLDRDVCRAKARHPGPTDRA